MGQFQIVQKGTITVVTMEAYIVLYVLGMIVLEPGVQIYTNYLTPLQIIPDCLCRYKLAPISTNLIPTLKLECDFD
jgi:hypothetical protein